MNAAGGIDEKGRFISPWGPELCVAAQKVIAELIEELETVDYASDPPRRVVALLAKARSFTTEAA